jgi:hypothetical protein
MQIAFCACIVSGNAGYEGMTESKSVLSLDEVRARRKKIAEEDRILAEIEVGLTQLEERWAAYRSYVLSPSSDAPSQVVIIEPKTSKWPPGYLSKEASARRTKNAIIIECLEKPRPLWQTAKDIQSYFEVEWSMKNVPMSSISPALTALKNNGTIFRRDMFVALALRLEEEEPDFLKENEPPEGGSETGEIAPSPIETPKERVRLEPWE